MSHSAPTILSTQDLCLSYGRVHAVRRLNITVQEGEIYGFLGRNGAGKTSTIRMLMGVIRPDAGYINLLDYRGRRIGVRQKQRIGYVSQEQHFYPWMTCLALGRFVSGFYPTWDHVEFDRLLQSLDLPPHRKVSHLSGGMRVKLALALALAHRPPILILDEPTSGLDPVTRREFLEIISRQARAHRRTTFFSSHLIDEVERVADRVGIIHRGELAYEGDVATLQASVRRVRYTATEDARVAATATDAGEEEPVPAETVDEPADEAPLIPAAVASAAAHVSDQFPRPPGITTPATADHRLQARRAFAERAESCGFRVLRDGFDDPWALILFAPPTVWQDAPFPVEPDDRLSLEDIFIALAGEAAPGPMIAALILKELRQHWLAFLLVGLLLGTGFLLVAGTVAIDESGSMFEALRRFLMTFVVLAAMVLGNRLVVREYQSQTQLFLEGLPVSRSRMVTVKYVFGLILLLAAVSVAFVTLIPLAARNEQLSARFMQLLAARTFAYTWCVYSFFFMTGLLGRYRVAIYVFGILGAIVLESLTRLELHRFGPFALVNDRFAYEYHQWPTEPLLVTLGLSAVFVMLTFALSITREGSLATLLAEKMSHREKIFVSALILGFLFAVTIYDEEATKQPFDLPQAVVAHADDVTVKVSVGASADEEQGQRLAEIVAGQTAALKKYLQLAELPPVFVVQRRDLDADQFERGVLDGAEGLLVRANFLSDDWDDGRFLSWLVRELLITASDERVQLERNMWVLDGFALYWVCRDKDSELTNYKQLELRAAYGARLGFAEEDLSCWLSYRERVGPDIASAVAWSGLLQLARSAGARECRTFLCTMLDCDVPADLRALYREWRQPLPTVLQSAAGLSLEQFRQDWSDEIAAWAESRSEDLATIPSLEGRVAFEPISDATRMVSYEFDCNPPPATGRFALWHTELPPFDDEVPVSELRREDLDYVRKRQGDVRGTYARGTRFYSTFSVRVEQLGCEVITGWTRREMK